MINNVTMIKHFYLITSFTFLSIFLSAQISPYIEYNMSFGGDTGIFVSDYKPLNDSTYIGCGFIMQNQFGISGLSPCDAMVFATHCSGKLLWMKSVHSGFTGHISRNITTVEAVTDSTFIFISNAYGFYNNREGSIIYLIDRNGQFVRKLFREQNSREIIGLLDVTTIRDSLVVLNSYGIRGNNAGPMISQFDEHLNLISENIYSGLSSTWYLAGNFPDIQTQDDLTYTTVRTELNEYGLLCTDAKGSVQYYLACDFINPFEAIPRYPDIGVGEDHILLVMPRALSEERNGHPAGFHISLVLHSRINGTVEKARHFYFDSLSIPGVRDFRGFEGNFEISQNSISRNWEVTSLMFTRELEGVPVRIVFDSTLRIIESHILNDRGIYQDSILSHSFLHFHVNNELLYGPISRQSQQQFQNAKNMGYVIGDEDFFNLVCHDARDITNSWSFEDVDVRIEIGDTTVIPGYDFDESPFVEVNLSPMTEVFCHDLGSLQSIIGLSDSLICIGEEITGESLQNEFVKSWQWVINDTLIFTNQSFTITPDIQGNYEVHLVVSDGCFRDTSTSYFSVMKGVKSSIDTHKCFNEDLLLLDSIFTVSGTHVITKINSEGCIDSVLINIEQEGAYEIVDTSLCKNQVVYIDELKLISDTTIRYVYSLDRCDSIVDVNYFFDQECECAISMPNAFTPNGDGINDFFHYKNDCQLTISSYLCRIYNRWGQIVFETRDANEMWDGSFKNEQALSEVYLLDCFLELENGEVYLFNQDITLIR